MRRRSSQGPAPQIFLRTPYRTERGFAPISDPATFCREPIAWLWHLYRLLWDKAVYCEDERQERQFSKTRGGIFLAPSAVFAWSLFIPAIVFLFHGILFLTTVKRDEVVYLTNSQEILPYENEHSVQGCHALPCTDQNSL